VLAGVNHWGQALQSNISKIIMLDHIIFEVIHKKVGHDFPGETFRVLKDKEEREFGECRTRHLVLKAWDINKPSLPWVLLINKV
jgi:hypothetical protein